MNRLREVKALLCDYVGRYSTFSLRPLPDPDGEIATTLAFATQDERLAEQVVDGLRAQGVNASPLLGPRGSNRHFAGDWEPILRQCGLPPVPADIVAATRKLLGSTVVVAIDLRWDDHDVRETLIAFERVLSLDGGHR